MRFLLKTRMKSKSRNQGVSLIYIVVVGTVTAGAALALGSSLLPMYNHVSSLSNKDQVIDISENSLRYAMAKYRDFASSDEDLQTITVDKLNPPDSIINNGTVKMELSDADLTILQAKGVYVASSYTYPLITTPIVPAYKFLTITASKGGFTHKIRLLLKPEYSKYPNSPKQGSSGGSGSTTVTSTLFTDALQANSTLRIGDGVNVNIVGGSNLGANIGSNGIVTLDGTSTISGNINAYTPASSSGTPTSIKATTDAKIMGNVSSSGNIVNVDSSITTPPLTSDASGGNVWGDGINGSTPTPGVVDNSSSLTQLAPVVTPQPGQQAQISGSLSAPTDITMSPGTSVSDLGSLRVAAGETVTIQPGNYVADSVTVENGGTLTVKSSGSDSSTGVNLYVNGSGETSVPVDIQGNVNFSGTTAAPNNFQVFYSGQKSLNLSTNAASNLYGLIYAPNASINVGLGANSSFHGAIVGDSVNVQKSGTSPGTRTIEYDPNSTNTAPPSSSGAAPAPQFGLVKSSSGSGYAVLNYRIISWEEPLK